MARLLSILRHFDLTKRDRRRVKKTLWRIEHEKKTENSKTHGRTANEKALH